MPADTQAAASFAAFSIFASMIVIALSLIAGDLRKIVEIMGRQPEKISEQPRYAFYKAYFEEKQRNLGKDPEEVLRKELGI